MMQAKGRHPPRVNERTARLSDSEYFRLYEKKPRKRDEARGERSWRGRYVIEAFSNVRQEDFKAKLQTYQLGITPPRQQVTPARTGCTHHSGSSTAAASNKKKR